MILHSVIIVTVSWKLEGNEKYSTKSTYMRLSQDPMLPSAAEIGKAKVPLKMRISFRNYCRDASPLLTRFHFITVPHRVIAPYMASLKMQVIFSWTVPCLALSGLYGLSVRNSLLKENSPNNQLTVFSKSLLFCSCGGPVQGRN